MTVMYNYPCEVYWSILALALEVIFSFLLSTFSQADIFCVIVLCMVRIYIVTVIKSGQVIRGHMFQCLSPNLLDEARTNVGLPPTLGFLNENDSLAYFVILGELSSGLSFTVGFIKTKSFLSSVVGFFRGQGRTYLATS